ncbi:hypothetical protein [Saccharothrix sp.]|uniref:hypothetical protein n=1 Tax=Saccharothrix sp. TaxID=1873460 RepID=UPI002811CB2D|nr:hypothetical protein [Saccharothrix sp.]
MTTLEIPTTTYAARLDAAHDSVAPDTPGVVVVGPGGFAYTTPRRLAEGPSWVSAATGRRLHGGDVRPVRNRVAARYGVACVQLVDPTPGDPARARHGLLRHHLLRAHTKVLASTVELAVADLGERTSAGGPLLGRQLVQAGLADAMLLVEETEGLLDGGHDVQPAVFTRLVRGGRALLRLLGGASFLIDGPGGAVLTAEQVGTLYLAAHHDH